MALSAMKNWFGRPTSTPADTPRIEPTVTPAIVSLGIPGIATPPLVELKARPAWTPTRLVATDALWGDGYQFPGGEIEMLRLAKPLGLSAACSLLLVGAGAGGPACSLATQIGVWVSAFESDPNLVAAALDRIARRNLSKHAQSELWNPEEPSFREHFYHHGMALEALRLGRPEQTLAAIAGGLKPSGHLMMIELVADRPLDPANPVVAAWAGLEHRDPKAVPTEVGITRILGRLGFDVRVAEDVSDRHTHEALMGWRGKVRSMEDVRPTKRQAMAYIEEAELWMLRLRLMHGHKLRLVRWHAIGRG